MKREPHVLIGAAGTGGHVLPALAVAQQLEQHSVDVHWAGRNHGLEYRLVHERELPYHTLNIEGIRGQGLKRLIQSPIRLLSAFKQARRLIKKNRPGCVLTMGGYISVPLGLAAYSTRTPLIIHEQNAICGLANKLLKPLAKQLLEGFPDTFKAKKAITTGNPVREPLLALPSPQSRFHLRQGPLRVFVFGGSQGARFLNEIVPEALARMPSTSRPEIFHQSGERQYDFAKSAYQRQGVTAQIVPYVDEMARAYDWADLVISRAGAMTVSEIGTVGVPSLLVPYPHSKDHHQVANARHLTDNGGAILYEQSNLTPAILAEMLSHLQRHRETLASMAGQAQALATPYAAQTMADACLTYLKDHS